MSVKIPAEYYCGRKDSGLAFITPDGTDQAAQKRKDTVNTWTQGYCHTSNATPALNDKKHFFSFKNSPQQGFVLHHSVTRYRTNNKLFEIEDPRGFRIQISAENLADVCKEGGIQQGHFLGTYVYGRDGRDNVLLATGSPRFKEAFEYTKVAGSKNGGVARIPLKELKIGMKVKLLYFGSLREVIYIGRRYHLESTYCRQVGCASSDIGAIAVTRPRYYYAHQSNTGYYRDVHEDRLNPPRHMFLTADPKPLNGQKMYRWTRDVFNPATPNVVEIVDKTAMTEAEVEAMVKQWAGPAEFPHEPSQWEKTQGYNSRPDQVCLFTLDKQEAEDLYKKRKPILDNWVPTQVPGVK